VLAIKVASPTASLEQLNKIKNRIIEEYTTQKIEFNYGII